jgi:hypothetical protein
MTRPDGARPVHEATVVRVDGGGSLRLPYADVLTLANALDRAGERALGRAGRAGAIASSPHLLVSAPFSPVTAAAAEAALAALGVALAAWSAQVAQDAASVRCAARLLALADEEVHSSLHLLEIAVADGYGREAVPPDVRPTDLQVPMSGVAPTGLPSVVDHAGEVSALSDDDHPENDGTVEVQTITGADGRRRHVVYLPGLDDPNPFGADGDVRDAGGAVALEAGLPTAYGAGVVEAMHRAGVRPGEPVLLVGHSQGGMEAAALAVQGTPYDVTQVVTLGAPVVPGHLPAGVHELSLEHEGDPIPLLDAGASDGSPGHVTVTFASGTSPVHPMADHGFPHYSAGAIAAEQSTDPTVQHAVGGLDPFLAQPGDQVRSTVLQITRGDRHARW